MNDNTFFQRAKRAVVKYYNANNFNHITEDDIYIIWSMRRENEWECFLRTIVSDCGKCYDFLLDMKRNQDNLDVYQKIAG